MHSSWEVIYQYSPTTPDQATVVIRPVAELATDNVPVQARLNRSYGLNSGQILGLSLLALGLGGFIGPLIPALRLESSYWAQKAIVAIRTPFTARAAIPELPKSAPVVINPLIAPDGSTITPVNTDFSLIIPKIGVNSPVIANVDPAKPGAYGEALLRGVAQASTSFTPDQNGTTYLFSHSTNYDWFVKDLNAVFYLLKNLEAGDYIALYYKGKQYTYQINQTKVVSPRDISYLVPELGKKSLVLQTCWPPGSVSERLLVFADFIQEQ